MGSLRIASNRERPFFSRGGSQIMLGTLRIAFALSALLAWSAASAQNVTPTAAQTATPPAQVAQAAPAGTAAQGAGSTTAAAAGTAAGVSGTTAALIAAGVVAAAVAVNNSTRTTTNH